MLVSGAAVSEIPVSAEPAAAAGGGTFLSCFALGCNPRVGAMQKNTASQKIGAQLVSATDGSAFTSAVTVYVTGDAGTQAAGSVGAGACTHEGNGYHTYAPAQAETNYDLIAFTFTGTGAVPVTVQVETRHDANVTHWLGTAAATPTVAGVPEVDVTHWIGTAAATPTTAGVPEVDVTFWNGTAVKSPTTAGVPEVCLTDAVAHGGTLGSSTATLAMSRVNYTSQTSNTTAFTVTGNGTGHGATFTSGSGATGDGIRFVSAATNGNGAVGLGNGSGAGFYMQGITGAGLQSVSGSTATILGITTATITANITGNLSGSVGSVTGAVGSVTGNVGGNVTGSVGSVATGGIAAASFAAGAINAAAVADGAIDRATFAADTGLQTTRSNTAQAGASTTITLDASASATNDFYLNDLVYITGGTGVGQVREILGYVGATKVATVRAWATNPDNTSTFAILPAVSVWDDITASHLTSGSTGNSLNAAGSAGDPWSTSLPGAYGAGTAGHILGTGIPDIAPGSANGLLRGGTNTATTFATFTITGAFSNNGVTDVAQTGDSYARIGATGSGLTSLAPSSTALSTATWTNTLATNIGTTNSTVLTNLDTTVGSRLAPTTAGRTLDVTATGAAGIDWGNVENPTTSVGLTGTTIQTAGLVTAIWDSTIATHTTSGTFGGALNSASSAGDPWSTAIPGAYAAGTAGYILGTNLNATVTSRMATYTQPTGFLSTVFGATVGTSTVTTAQVNAEVVDALSTDTYTEPTGAPGATVSLAEKIGRLYQIQRNKVTVTASAMTFYSDTGTTLWSKALSDDNTTYVEAEGS